MKFRPLYIAIIVILVIIIAMVSSSGASFVPYSKPTLFSHEYVYEGMAPANVTELSEVKKDAVPPTKGTEQAPPSWTATVAKFFGYHPSPACEKGDCKKVEGFALQPAPFAESPVLDRYGKTPSGPECVGQGSGYSKSLGPLCMSEEDKRMLSTRGGNSTGKDSTIGQP